MARHAFEAKIEVARFIARVVALRAKHEQVLAALAAKAAWFVQNNLPSAVFALLAIPRREETYPVTLKARHIGVRYLTVVVVSA